MRRLALLVCFVLGMSLTSAAWAGPTLAVTYFDNNTGQDRFDPLGRGLADMLITDLTNLSGVQVVERGRLNEVLAELKLQQSAFVDPKTAAAVGKGVGATWVLTGSFSAVEPQMRIDARVIEVATGKVRDASEVTGPVDEFFLLEKELASAVVAGLQVDVSARESAKLGRIATESFEAFFQYSRGLEAIDRGALDEGRAALQKALQEDDRFAMAEGELDRLQAMLDQLSRNRQDKLAEATQAAMTAFEQASRDGEGLEAALGRVVVEIFAQQRPRDVQVLGRRILELDLPEDVTMGPHHPQSANAWALGALATASWTLRNQADLLTYGEALLARYPTDLQATAVETYMRLALEQLAREREGAAQRAAVEASARLQGLERACSDARQRASQRLPRCRALGEHARAHPTLPADDVQDALEDWIEAAGDGGSVEELQAEYEAEAARDPYGEWTQKVERQLTIASKRRENASKEVADLEKRKAEGKVRWYDYRDALRALLAVGREPEARALMDEALAAFPAEPSAYADVASHLLDLDDRDAFAELLPRWEAVAKAAGAEVNAHLVRQAREAGPGLGDPAGWEAWYLALGLDREGANTEAGARWEALARQHPDFPHCDAFCALTSATASYWAAWNTGAVVRVWREVEQRFPEQAASHWIRSQIEVFLP